MTARRAAAAALLLLAGPLARAEGGSAEVAAWLTGTFEAKDAAADGALVRIVVVSVPKSRIANGFPVLYREQATAPKLDEPTLQRFYRLEEDGDVVRVRVFEAKDPLIVRGKWRDPSILSLYGANDLRERRGCEIPLKKTGGRWEGQTPDATGQEPCPSFLRNVVRVTSSVSLSKDDLVQWDRGFDEKGKQTWGSRTGGTTFVKTSASAPADNALVERTVGRRAEENKESGKTSKKEKEKEKTEDSSKANGAPGQAPALVVTSASPSSPSKKYSLADLRALAGSERLPVSRLFPSKEISGASVVVVTSRSGSVSVFSSAEISSSSGAPEIDLATGAPRLVAASGRGLDDVVSVELRVLAPAR